MARKRGGTVLMALGAVLALIAGGIVFVVAQNATAAPVAEKPSKDVVVAVRDISERTVITRELIKLVKIPEDVIPGGAAFKLEEVENKFAREKIRAGTPVLEPQVGKKPGEPPLTTQPAKPAAGKPPPAQLIDAAYILEKGKTIVAVDYPEAAKMITAGLLRPGNKVDIYVKTPGAKGEQIALIYSNIEIKAIGTLSQTEEAAPSSTLLFIVEPQQALELKFIESMNPFLLLRAAGDEQAIKTDLVTTDYITRKFGLQPVAR